MSTPFSIEDIDKLLVKELQQKLDEYNQPYGKKDTKPILQNKLRAYMESNRASSSSSRANPKSKTAKAPTKTPSEASSSKPVIDIIKNNENFVNIFKTMENRNTKKSTHIIENVKHVNVQDENSGATALHWAVRNNDVEAVEFLLSKKGINKEIAAKDGGTPLHWGTYDQHNGDAIKVLLEANVNIEAKNKDGNTPLVIALNPQSNMKVMKYVSQMANKYPIKRGGKEVQWNVAKILLDAGAKIAPWSEIYDDETDSKHYKPLLAHFVINAKYTNNQIYFDLIHFLLQYKPNLEEEYSSSDGTPLIIAAGDGQANIVKWLLEAGADINNTDDKGNTPLMKAAMKNNLNTVKQLIDEGANIDVKNKEKQTAFYIALHHGNIDICKLLLEHKATHYPYYYEDVDNNYIDQTRYLRYNTLRNATVEEIKQKLLDAGLIFMRPPKFSIAKTENDIQTMCKNNYKLYADEEDYNCPITYSKLEPEHTIIIRSKKQGGDDAVWCYSLEGMIGMIESIDRLPFVQRKYRNPQTTEEFSREEVATLRQILEEYKTKIAQLHATTGGRNKTKKKKILTITSRQMRILRFLQQNYKNIKNIKNKNIRY